jgi:uncharacterized protein YbaP (TraB family)
MIERAAMPLGIPAILAMALLALPAAAAEPRVGVEPFSRGVLWRVSKPGVAASHVFGTIHVADPRVLLIPDAVHQALAQARSFVLEIDTDGSTEARFSEAAQFEDGRSLEPLIGAEAYAQVLAGLRERNVPEAIIARLKPWAALANLTVTPADYASITLDQKLRELARARRLPVYGLEGIEEQIAVFDGIPLDTQVALLRHGLAERDYFVGLIEPTIRAWLSRDLAGLHAVQQRTLARFPAMAGHYRTLSRHIVDNRSVVMAHRLFTPLRKGRAFVAIGADHLYGGKGVLQLLRRQGYRVARVY